MRANDTLLIRALRLNAMFSATSAGLLLLAAPWVAAQLGLPGTLPVYATAALLAAFALQLASIVRSGRIRSWEIAGIIGWDIAWVVGSVILVAVFYRSLSLAGLIIVDAVAVAVLYFAIQQIRGLRAVRRDARA
jgi:hypothetical protein